MSKVNACELPQDAILRRYSRARTDLHGHVYTDCFTVQIDRRVSLEEFVLAFYTTPLFRAERMILGLIGRPSSDQQALQLSQGAAESFAAWSVEDRTEKQLLMRDFRGRTRSWFMVFETVATSGPATQLLFGSAVVPATQHETQNGDSGRAFKLLLGFHELYSKALLSSAARRLFR
jgi:hypothetical protein